MRTVRSTHREQVNFMNKSTRENQTSAPPTPLCFWFRSCHPSPRQHHCPAFGKRCSKCGIVGHFARACKGGTRKQAGNRRQSNFVDDDADEAFVAECKATHRPAKKFVAHLHLVHDGKSKIVRAQIDSASTCNTMPSNLLSQLFPNLKVSKTRSRISTYGSQKMRQKRQTRDNKFSCGGRPWRQTTTS